MTRLSIIAVALALVAAGCSSSTSPSSSTPTNPTFTAALSPANEVPPVTNSESVVTGNVSITLVTTKDSAGNITLATATFFVNLANFPAGSSINTAHIHEGASTCVCPVVVPLGVVPGEVTVTNGVASFTKANVNVDAAIAQRLLNNPGGFYFNVHTVLNGSGVARGVLQRVP